MTVAEYVAALRQRMLVIARKLGSDISRLDKQTRVIITALLILLSVLIKTLVDKGVITNAELLAVLNAARDEAWPGEPAEPPEPPEGG